MIATDTFVPPMLSTDLSKVRGKLSWEGAMLQEKLDGWRCIASKRGGYVYLFTRTGTPIDNCPHIQHALDPRMIDGETFDGELYRRGMPLHQIASRAQGKAMAFDLQLHVFDKVEPVRFFKRYKQLCYAIPSRNVGTIRNVPARFVSRKREAINMARRFISAGGEGAILRLMDSGYLIGERSRAVIKIKKRHL